MKSRGRGRGRGMFANEQIQSGGSEAEQKSNDSGYESYRREAHTDRPHQVDMALGTDYQVNPIEFTTFEEWIEYKMAQKG